MGKNTNFPFGRTAEGIQTFNGSFFPAGAPGNVYFIHPAAAGAFNGQGTASDGNIGSIDKPMSTLSGVHSKMTANQNDTAVLIGNSSASAANVVSEASALTWSKNLCHIMGTAYNRISHRCSIRPSVKTIANFITVSASGCVFSNFHVFSDDDDNEAEIAWTETGQRNAHFNLHIAGMGATGASNPRDSAGSRHLKLTGDGERLFKDCVIGIDTADRGAANANLELSSAAVRDIFEDCIFLCQADAATPVFVNANASGAIDRFAYFKKCLFMNGVGSTATSMTEAMTVHASAGGIIILHDCQLVGAGDWEKVQSSNVYVEAAQAAATSGRMVASTT